MHLTLQFSDINPGVNDKMPQITIMVNAQCYYQGIVQNIELEVADAPQYQAHIYFINKTDQDTVVDGQNNIVQDMNFSLVSIKINQIDIGHMIWNSTYHYDNGNIPSCLFFGPPGYFAINIPHDILAHQACAGKNPRWQQDLDYYKHACNLLDRI